MLLEAPARAARTPHEPLGHSLRFDRRHQPRSNRCGRVVATFRDSDGMIRLTWMDLLDTSDMGLGLRSPIPVPDGAVVTFFSAERPDRSSRRLGVGVGADAAMAVSCEPDHPRSGYRVGFRVSRCSAA